MPLPEKGQKGFRPKQESLINYSDLIEDAKQTAVSIMGEQADNNVIGVFYETDLQEVEYKIRYLNDMASKCWLISAIALYALIYDKGLYQQSGLAWNDYLKESKSRLNMDSRDIAESLASARFFMKHHKELERAKWNPVGSARKLARAELAVELSGSVKETIQHLAHDTWAEFNEWYSSFKEIKQLPQSDKLRDDIVIKNGKVFVDGNQIVDVNKNLPQKEQDYIKEYLATAYNILKQGYEPAIIAVYDKKEAKRLERLRDKDRQTR